MNSWASSVWVNNVSKRDLKLKYNYDECVRPVKKFTMSREELEKYLSKYKKYTTHYIKY